MTVHVQINMSKDPYVRKPYFQSFFSANDRLFLGTITTLSCRRMVRHIRTDICICWVLRTFPHGHMVCCRSLECEKVHVTRVFKDANATPQVQIHVHTKCKYVFYYKYEYVTG